MRTTLMILTILVLLAGVFAVFGWQLLIPRLTYYPEGLTEAEGRPGRWGLSGAAEARVATEDGLSLHGWWVPADPRDRSRCDAAVIYFHGNAGSIAGRAGIARELSRRGLDVLLFDYRGYGRSEGRPSEAGFRRDAEGALRYVVEEQGVPASRVVLMGQSLGSAVAARLALDHPAAALVLGAPFPGLPAAVGHHAPWLPVRLLRWREGRYEGGSGLADLRMPLLVLLGERDTLVPPALTERVFAAAPEPRTLVRVDADHNTLVMHPASWVALDDFLRRHLGCGG